ncbi:MAG: hypothetical protein GX111_06805 [Clostridiales bacterium]|nr:hypothetical protein [Clostridiales bacterium]
MKNFSRTEEIDLAAKYDGGQIDFFLTICAAALRQNGCFYEANCGFDYITL